tara:strand:- start:5743 stop:6153 length:411 start_codon:yes stop_codon:yes gene_type:complete
MTGITNKRSFVHRANRNRVEESDMPIKTRLLRYFNKKGVHFLLDEQVPILRHDNSMGYKLPDLYERTNKMVIEIDGPVHGDGENVTRKTTDKMIDYMTHDIFPCNVPLEWCEEHNITPEQFIEVYIQLHKTWRLTH